MKRLCVLVCCASILFLFSCTEQEGRERPASLEKVKAQYDSLAKRMVQSMAYVGEPLKDLTDEQLAAVAALIVMTRVASLNEGIEAIKSTSLSEGFWVELPEICPPMPESIQLELGGCLDEELAYAEAMSKCRDEGKSEEECDRETAGELSAAVMCRMRQIEEMKRIIEHIPGRWWPPSPFPWPEAPER